MACSNYEEVLKEAKSQIGLSESPKGSNNGKALRLYLNNTTFEPGEPWCLYFCLAVIKRAAQRAKEPIPSLKWTGSTMELLRWAREHTEVIPGENGLSTGSIGLIHSGNHDRVHHAVIVAGEDPTNPDNYLTVEGNTNDGGSREGYKVAKRSRPKNRILQVIY